MSDYEQEVFISYAWGGDSEQVVDQIDHALQKRGIKILRDKRVLGYKGSISEFMERIGRGNCVIVVISDKYLRSPNCMYELIEISRNKEFRDRIFPIVLQDADIYNPVNRIKYIKYWEEKLVELDQALKTVSAANLVGLRDEIDSYDNIRDNISELTFLLKDMNTFSLDMHKDSEFSTLYDSIERRMKETNSADIQSKPSTFGIELFEPITILIPEGPFLMGCPSGEGIPVYMTPEHTVRIQEYYIGIEPVTNRQYLEFIQRKEKIVPQIMRWKGQSIPDHMENQPALGITWKDAMEYCRWLSEITGRKYSLPNEAQWEKARRGSYSCADGMGKFLEWTCSLWGEKRNEPDAKFLYPWKDDERNNLNANCQVRRVVRGNISDDLIGLQRSCARYGRSVDDPGSGDTRHGFRIILKL